MHDRPVLPLLCAAAVLWACSADAPEREAVRTIPKKPTAALEFPRVELGGDDSRCKNHELRLTGLGDDVGRIFAGKETPAEGTRLPLEAELALRFNGAVDFARLREALRVYGAAPEGMLPCAGADPAEYTVFALPTPEVAPRPSGAAWSAQAIASGAQATPRDFNAVVFGDYSGTGSVLGPIAAQGKVTLQSFSLNSSSGKPIAIVAGGNVTAANGSITGGIRAPSTSLPGSVTVSGGIAKTAPIDFGALRASMTALSTALSGQLPTGQVRFEGGTLRLIGREATVNVFRIEAAHAKLANLSIELEIPSGAMAVVNVRGSDAALQDSGLTLRGADAGHVLWNFPEARTLRIAGIGAKGSVLAPSADVSMTSGSLEGTIVARSLDARVSLGWVPLATWPEMRINTTTLVTRLPRLLASCPYTFAVDTHTPLDEKGSCLGGPSTVSFLAAEDDRPRFERETARVFWSDDGSRATAFEVREGIQLTMEELLERYRAELGLGSGEGFTREGDLLPDVALSAGEPAMMRGYYPQQYSAGGVTLPVMGRGLLTRERDGFVRSLRAQIVPQVSAAVSGTVSAERAVKVAAAKVSAPPYPWSDAASGARVPSATLMLGSMKARPGPTDYAPVWRVSFAESGVEDVREVMVDAGSGAVLRVESSRDTLCEDVPVQDQKAWVATLDLREPATCLIPVMGQDNSDWVKETSIEVPCERRRESGNAAAPWHWFLQEPERHIYARDNSRPGQEGLSFCDPDGAFMDAPETANATLYWLTTRVVEHFEGLNFAVPDYSRAAGGELVSTGYWGLLGFTVTSVDPACVQGECTLGLQSSGGLAEGWGSFIELRKGEAPGPFGLEVLTLPAVAHEYAHAIANYGHARSFDGIWSGVEAETIEEGFADAMALTIDLGVTGRFNSPLFAYLMARNPENPEQYGKPSAFGDPHYLDMKLEVDPHHSATVVTRWFTILAKGMHGENSLHQVVDLPAIAPSGDLATSVDMASRIFFNAVMFGLAPSPTFMELRDATIESAALMYGKRAAEMVAAAWRAVGLSTHEVPGSISPADRETNVSPWPAIFKVPTHAVGGFFQLSRSPAFDGVELDVAIGASGIVNGGLLLPETQYYWRVRDARTSVYSVLDPVNTFRTAAVEPRVVYPAVAPGAVAMTDGEGRLILTHVSFERNLAIGDPTVTGIIASVHTSEPDRSTKGWTGEVLAPYQVAGDGSPVAAGLLADVRGMLQRSGTQPAVGVTYWLKTMAVGGLKPGYTVVDPESLPLEMDQRGAVVVIPFQLSVDKPRELAPIGAVPIDGEVTFGWYGAAGATKFRLVVLEAASDWASTGKMGWHAVFDQYVQAVAGDVRFEIAWGTSTMPGYSVTFPKGQSPIKNPVPYRWYVLAETDGGVRTSAPPASNEWKVYGALPAPQFVPQSASEAACNIEHWRFTSFIRVKQQPGAVRYRVQVEETLQYHLNQVTPEVRQWLDDRFVIGSPTANVRADGDVDLFPIQAGALALLRDIRMPRFTVVPVAAGDLEGQAAVGPAYEGTSGLGIVKAWLRGIKRSKEDRSQELVLDMHADFMSSIQKTPFIVSVEVWDPRARAYLTKPYGTTVKLWGSVPGYWVDSSPTDLSFALSFYIGPGDVRITISTEDCPPGCSDCSETALLRIPDEDVEEGTEVKLGLNGAPAPVTPPVGEPYPKAEPPKAEPPPSNPPPPTRLSPPTFLSDLCIGSVFNKLTPWAYIPIVIAQDVNAEQYDFEITRTGLGEDPNAIGFGTRTVRIGFDRNVHEIDLSSSIYGLPGYVLFRATVEDIEVRVPDFFQDVGNGRLGITAWAQTVSGKYRESAASTSVVSFDDSYCAEGFKLKLPGYGAPVLDGWEK